MEFLVANQAVMLEWAESIWQGQDGTVRELWARRGQSKKHGYYDTPELLVGEAVKLNAQGYSTYLTVNGVDRAAFAEAVNKPSVGVLTRTRDEQVLSRKWLYIDCDSIRPGPSEKNEDRPPATDAEHQTAVDCAADMRQYFENIGWPAPLFASSGNGAYLVYRVELPNDDASTNLVEAILEELKETRGTPHVNIDLVVKNAGRLARLIGSVNWKGRDSATDNRPNRLTKLLAPVPEHMEVLSAEQMTAYAGHRLNRSTNRKTRYQAPEGGIGPGNRVSELRKVFWSCLGQGFNEEIARDTVRSMNAGLEHPLEDRQLDKEVLQLTDTQRAKFQDRGEKGGGKKNSLDSQVEKLDAVTGDVHFLHDDQEILYARTQVGERMECLRINSRFERAVRHRYKETHDSMPGKEALAAYLELAKYRAQTGPEEKVHIRIAHVENKIYVDLANAKGEVIEVDSAGWRVLPVSPVNFTRPKSEMALPTPERGGSFNELRPLLNASKTNHWILMVAWLVGVLQPKGTKSILLLQGVMGAAKSSTSKALRKVIDPNVSLIDSPPKDAQNLAIRASKGAVTAFDNLSSVPEWLSDAFCRMVSGVPYTSRELYSDDEEVILRIHISLILNGIPHLGDRGDLADRAISLWLGRMVGAGQKTDEEVDTQFEAIHARVLGALLDACSIGLSNRGLAEFRLTNRPRLADFAEWICTCEPGLPWERGAFMKAYDEITLSTAVDAVENDPFATAVLNLAMLVKKRPAHLRRWTPGDLLKILREHKPDGIEVYHWPQSARALGHWLLRAAPVLHKVQVSIAQKRSNGVRYYHLGYGPEQMMIEDLNVEAEDVAA